LRLQFEPTLSAGSSNDQLTGGDLGAIFSGNGGNDGLYGGGGHDELYGENGRNTLNGGGALTNCTVEGPQISLILPLPFCRQKRTLSWTILSLARLGLARIWLDDAVFSSLSVGVLPANAFVLGMVALDENDRIIYDQTFAHKLYDADDAGGASAKLFAIVQVGTTLTAADFAVF
jgi:hypothetical protein